MSFGCLGLDNRFGKLGAGGKSGTIPELPGIISARTGSFTLTGDAMSPLVAYMNVAAVGTFNETGVAAGLLYGRVVTAAQATFALTGIDAALTKASPPSFTGIADNSIYGANVVAYWGLRAAKASLATGSTPAIDVVDQAGANSLTVNINSSGDLDVSAINTWVTANSVTEIHVSKIYDQIGTNHMTQGTDANRPKLLLSQTSTGKAAIVSRSGNSALVAGSSAGLTQQFTSSIVYKRGGSSGFKFVFGTSGSGIGTIFCDTPASTAALFAGAVSANFTKTDGAFGSVQGMFDSSSSKARFGGSTTTGLNPGTGGLGTPAIYDSSWGAGTDLYVCEVAAISGDQSASFAAANTNQDTYWGT